MFWIVLTGILSIVFGIGLFCVRFLVAEQNRAKFYKIVALVDFGMIAAIIAGYILRRFIPAQIIMICGNICTVILSAQIICAALVIVALIVSKIYGHFQKPVIFSRSRRDMILRSAIIYPAMGLAASVYANQYERENTVDRFFDIPSKNLSPELDGLRIAQISDIHLGAYFSLERLEKLLSRIAETKPDILAITGDIFDDEDMNPTAIRLVDSFTDKFKYGIYYCHGNHEYIRGIAEIEKALKDTNIKVLINRSEKVAGNLYMIGADWIKKSPIMESDENSEEGKLFKIKKSEALNEAVEGIPENSVCVLLAHHPEFIDDGAERKFLLTLTGHTHGSQVGIFGLPLFPLFKYTRGMVENDESFGYVHSGNGSWFPFRLGCPPEIAYFTLKRKED